MSSGLTIAIVLAAFAVSIAVGFKFKVNIGLLALGFALLIGCMIVGMPLREVVALWPVQIFFMLLAVTLFYGYAVENGTLKLVAGWVLYWCRHFTWALPFVVYLLSAALAATGAGGPAVNAFMAPVVFGLAYEAGMQPIIATVAICCGSLAGSTCVFSQGGVIMQGILGAMEEYSFAAFRIGNYMFLNAFVEGLLFLALFYIIFKGYRLKKIEIKKPEKADRIQKLNLILIIAVMALLIIPAILGNAFPDTVWKRISGWCDIKLLALIGACLCGIMKLGKERTIISKVPWNTIIMVSGMAMLASVATQVGAVDMLANWIGTSIPTILIVPLLIVVTAFLSFFTTAMSSIVPMFFPLVPSIAAATGINPILLFSAIMLGANSTCIYPLSAGGSLLLAGVLGGEEEKNRMFYLQIVAAFAQMAFVILLAVLGLFSLFEL